MGVSAPNQCSLSVVIVIMYFPFWLYMLEIDSWICMVGLFGKMSLSGLYSCVDILRLMIFKGVYKFVVLCLGIVVTVEWMLEKRVPVP